MFDLDPTQLFFTIFFSMVGIAYYSYGKKESLYYRFAGIGLMIYPYFVSSNWGLGLFGALLMILPIVLDRIFPL